MLRLNKPITTADINYWLIQWKIMHCGDVAKGVCLENEACQMPDHEIKISCKNCPYNHMEVP